MKYLAEFDLGDVEDPYICAQLHIESMKKNFPLNKWTGNLEYILVPNETTMGWTVQVLGSE